MSAVRTWSSVWLTRVSMNSSLILGPSHCTVFFFYHLVFRVCRKSVCVCVCGGEGGGGEGLGAFMTGVTSVSTSLLFCEHLGLQCLSTWKHTPWKCSKIITSVVDRSSPLSTSVKIDVTWQLLPAIVYVCCKQSQTVDTRKAWLLEHNST